MDGIDPPPLALAVLFITCAASAMDVDGHSERGGLFPSMPLLRHMWTGGRVGLKRPLTVSEDATRKSAIKAVAVKERRSGTLVFVTVLHKTGVWRGLAITVQQDYPIACLPGHAAI